MAIVWRTYRLDEEIVRDFKTLCSQKKLYLAKQVEILMKQWIEANTKAEDVRGLK